MSQIKFGSVCSGIEAASVAWHPLGWKTAWLSEIEKFPSQVLAHHYPNTPNFGDMTKFKEWSIESDVNVLVGGTPCQSFSVAGLRKGLDDPRGNLMLTYLAIAAKYRPRWLVWENVPGVLSSNGGLDFASLLRGMGECGYGFAYRILDAQYFGVAQRRRRVFVVGYLGNWRPAAAVLFERHSLQGHPAPSREERQRVASFTPSSIGGYSKGVGTLRAHSGDIGGGSENLVATQHSQVVPTVFAADLSQKAEGIGYAKEQAPCLTSGTHPGHGVHVHQTVQPIAFDAYNQTTSDTVTALRCAAGGVFDNTVAQPIDFRNLRLHEGNVAGTMQSKATGGYSLNYETGVLQPIPLNSMNCFRSLDADASTGCGIGEEGEAMFTITKTNSHAVAQPIPFDTTQITSKANYSKPQAGDPCHPLAAGAHPPAICLMDQGGSVMTIENDMTGTLRRETHGHEPIVIAQAVYELHSQDSRVRKLGDVCSTVSATYGAGGGNVPITIQPIGLDEEQNAMIDAFGTLKARTAGGGFEGSVMQTNMAVRRLTPVECERLQGFPDGYTDIQPKGKATPDGPRYKALGNSMAVPVMAWIGQRIQQVEDILG